MLATGGEDDEKRILYQAGRGRHFKKQKIVFSVYFDMYLYDHDVLYRSFLSISKELASIRGGEMLQGLSLWECL